MARRLAAAGAAVVLAARSEDEVEAVAAALRKQGSRAIAVAGDVSDLGGVEEIVESALEQFDRVDIGEQCRRDLAAGRDHRR